MQSIRLLKPAALVAASLICLPALAAPKAPRVIASLTQPPGGLDCERAADEAKVVFDFQQPRSDVKQISVFVNGEGVPEKDVDQEWPTVTVLHGFDPGRNTVELVAKGKDGKATSHKLTVLVGERPQSRDKDVAVVDCLGRASVATRDPEPDDDSPWGEVLQSEDGLDEDDEAYDEVVDEVVYEGPSYVYYPYPSFGYVYYAPVYYYPWPYYYSTYYYPYHHHRHYYGGYYGSRYYYGGGYYADRHYHRSEPGRAYRDGGNASPRRYEPSRPATHSQPRGGGSAYRGGGSAYRSGGDHNRDRR